MSRDSGNQGNSLTVESIENIDLDTYGKQTTVPKTDSSNPQSITSDNNTIETQGVSNGDGGEEEPKNETCCSTKDIYYESNKILVISGSPVDFTLDWEQSPDTLQNIYLKPPQPCVDTLHYDRCGMIISLTEDSDDLPHDDHVLRTFIDALKKVVAATNAIVTTSGRNSPVTCACNAMVTRLRNMKFTSQSDSQVMSLGIDAQPQDVQDKILETLEENKYYDPNQRLMFLVQTNETLSSLEKVDTVESTERLLVNDPTCRGRTIPRVLVVYGGTMNTLRRIFCAAKEKTRIVIIKGSGGVADVLSTVKPEKWSKMDSFLGKEYKNEVGTLMSDLQKNLPEVSFICDSMYSLGVYLVKAAFRDNVQYKDKVKVMCRNIVQNGVDLLSDLLDSEGITDAKKHHMMSVGEKVLESLSWEDLEYLYKNIPADAQIRSCLIDFSSEEETFPSLRSINKELMEIGIHKHLYYIDYEDYNKMRKQREEQEQHAKENGGNQTLQETTQEEPNNDGQGSSRVICGCFRKAVEDSDKAQGDTKSEISKKIRLKKRPSHLDVCAWYLLTEQTEGAKMLWIKSSQMTIKETFVSAAISDGLQKIVYGETNIKTLKKTSQDFIEHATNLLHDSFHLGDGEYHDKSQTYTETLLLRAPDGYMCTAYDLHKTAFFRHRSVKDILQKKWWNSPIDDTTTMVLTMVLALRDFFLFPFLFLLFPVFVIFKPDILQNFMKRLDNAAVKCLLNTMSYFAFLFLYCYMILSDVNDFMTWIDFLLIVWVICYAVDEVRQIYQSGGDTIKLKLLSYATWYNVLDMLCIIVFAVGMVLKSIPFGTFEAGRVLLAIDIILFIVRILNLTSLSLTLGPKSVMIRRMFVYDLIPFMAIMFVFLVAFSVADYSLLYPNTEMSWDLIENVLGGGYWILYGDNNVEDFTRDEPDCSHNMTVYESGTIQRCPTSVGQSAVPYIRAVFALIAVILLLNVLIAMFNDTYKRVQDFGRMHWMEEYRNLVTEYDTKPLLPPPFTALLIPHLILLVIIWFCTSPIQLIMSKDESENEDEKKPSKIDFFFRLYLYGENKYEEFESKKMREQLSEFEKYVKTKYSERHLTRKHIDKNEEMDEVQEIRTKTDRLTRQLIIQREETKELRQVTKDLTKRIEDLMTNFDSLVKMMGRKAYRLSWAKESSDEPNGN